MMQPRHVLPKGLHIALCTALEGPAGGLASMSLAGGPGAGCPGGALRAAWAARLAHPLLRQTRAGVIRPEAGMLVHHQSRAAKPSPGQG